MHAIIENGLVVNVVVWDGDETSWQPPEGMTAVALDADSPVTIGYSYDGLTFSAPETEQDPDDTESHPVVV